MNDEYNPYNNEFASNNNPEKKEEPVVEPTTSFVMMDTQAENKTEQPEERQSSVPFSTDPRPIPLSGPEPGSGYYNQSRPVGQPSPDMNQNRHYQSTPNQNTVNQSWVKPETKTKKKKIKNKLWKKVVAVGAAAVMFGVVASLAFQGTNKLMGTNTGSTTPIPQVATQETVDDTSVTNSNTSSSDVSKVAQEALPSVVAITSTTAQSSQPFMQGSTGESSGSGFIIGQSDTELLIATNNHVIANAEKITAVFVDGSSVEAVVKGTDPTQDLAVVAVDLKNISEDTVGKIKVAVLGDSDALTVGEPVIAIGNALGYGQSVTTGIVSALDREVTVENMSSSLIQTDAAINPGNSGGALLNMKGEVIGINAVKYSDSTVEGMGYAIPISEASPILDNLMSQTTRNKVNENEQGFLGIGGYDVTSDIAEYYEMPTGVYVKDVNEGGAAANAGIRSKDIIVKFDGKVVDSMSTLQNILKYYSQGEEVTITIQRLNQDAEYESMDLTIQLGSKS